MNRILQFLVGWISRAVGLVKINRISIQRDAGVNFVHKSRVPLSWVLVLLGNFVFRLRCVPVAVMCQYEWMRWERTVKRLTRDEDATIGREFVCQFVPGATLASSLRRSDSYLEKQERIAAAARSLHGLHRLQVNVVGIGTCLLSHGDASITNVIYDSKSSESTWIDFDLRHDFQFEAMERHADDLRSLLFSSVHLFDDGAIETWIESQRLAYPAPEVWKGLAKQISSRRFAIDVFHRAQLRRARRHCELSRQELARIESMLVRAIISR